MKVRQSDQRNGLYSLLRDEWGGARVRLHRRSIETLQNSFLLKTAAEMGLGGYMDCNS